MPDQPLFEPLTRREREILTFLAEGFSAPEIAEQLTLAISSVKFHIQNIYGKLGARSKRQALTRAGELGLLEAVQAGSLPGSTPFQAPPRPPARSGPAARHNLPLQVTQFFGREAEIAQLKERLTTYRLVTLSGSGGVGKTRLSLQAAEQVLRDFVDGVWLVELAPLTDPALVPQQAAAVLGVRDEPGRPMLETLLAYLRERQILLVLDNCEHLLEACARLAEALLRACPRVKLLASSREPLGIPGEAIFPIPSLPFPETDLALSADRMQEFASVQLFVDRARMVLPDYQLAAHNAPAITRICQRLDGIPLAIEMAAARVNVVTADQLAQRLDDVFRVLTGGSRTALPRQQTLRATVDWSYKLLNEHERLLLQRLSVFAGGWLLEAAEAVCSGDGIEAGQVLDLLAALVAKSMVIADRPAGGEPRYHLLETVRQYGREKLQDTDDGVRLRTRHRNYFLAFAESSNLNPQTRKQVDWFRKLEAESDNLRSALEWSFDDPADAEAGPRLVLTGALLQMSSYQERHEWFRKGLAVCESRADISARLHVKLLESVSNFEALNDPPAALILSERAVDISRGLGPDEKETLMWSLFNLAMRLRGDIDDVDSSVAPMAEAEAILQLLPPDHYERAASQRVRAYFAIAKAQELMGQRQYQQAKILSSEAMRISQEAGGWPNTAFAQLHVGMACLQLGEYAGARDHFLAALIASGEQSDQRDPFILRWLAMAELRQGNLSQAIEICRESIRLADALPDRNIIASCLGILAEVSAKNGQPVRAARLAGASAAMWARQKRKPWEDSSLDTLLPGWRDGPEYSALNDAFEAGQAMSADQAVALALENPDPKGL